MSFKADIRVFAREAEENPELARESLWKVLAILEQAQKSVKRDGILVIVLAAAFEMVNRKLIGEASALGIKAARLDFLKYVLPVAVGYVTFRAGSFLRERELLTRIYLELTRTAFPMLDKSNVDVLLYPSSNAHQNSIPESWLTSRTNKLTTFLDYAEGAMVRGIVPIGFIIYAAAQLFRSSDPPFVAALISTLLATILTVGGFLSYYLSQLDTADVVDKADVDSAGATPPERVGD